jgi:hypothetical protein
MDADLTTPMARLPGGDFYLHEPAMISNGQLCIVNRWYIRDKDKMYAQVSYMEKSGNGWVVSLDQNVVDARELLMSFPNLIDGYHHHGLPDPRNILGKYFYHIF